MEAVDLQLNLDSAPYVQGAQAALQSTRELESVYAGFGQKATAFERALNKTAPGRAFLGSFGAATAAAASWEQQLGGLQATASVTGQSVAKLQTGISSLARTMPVGNRGALEITQTLQQMGYAAPKQVATIQELSKSFVNLGAATGTNAAMIGRQMVQLNRAFGATDNNVTRFNKMSDSLTNVTTKIGGSATDILAFSKAIAPMARSAGIGQTAVMGIAGAFSKMGEDGFIASNAMNKVLTDMNRSVRDGTSEMGTYANIVGKTREQFEALFKTSPNEALAQVMEQLGGAGPGSERNLERLGLDGVRTQRALQAVSQQGGIRAAMGVGVGGYGDGSTATAAQQAMDGLVDEFQKLTSASEQVAEALGRPFLGAITKVIQVTGTPTKMAASVLNNETVQTVLKYAIPTLMGYMGLRAIGAAGTTGQMLRLMANNGLVRGLMEGNRAATNPNAPMGMMRTAQAEGRLANMGLYGRASTGMINVGAGWGESRARFQAERANQRFDRLVAGGMSARDAQTAVSTAGPSVRQRAAQAGRAVVSPRNWLNTIAAGQRTWNNLNQDINRQLLASAQDPTHRRNFSRLRIGREHALPAGYQGPQGPATGAFGAMGDNWRNLKVEGAGLQKRMASVGVGMLRLGQQTAQTGTAVAAAGTVLKQSLINTALGLRGFGAALAATGIGGGLARGAKAVGGMFLNPMMLATMGTMFAFSKHQGDQQEAKERSAEIEGLTGTSTIDEYRNSIGAATEATQTFAERARSASEALMKAVSTSAQAIEVTAADISYAEQTKGEVVNKYSGSNESIAAQIRAFSPQGLKPQDEQAIKIDLLRQVSPERAEEIMRMIGGEAGPRAEPTDYAGALEGTAGQSGVGAWTNFRRGLFGQQGNATDAGNQGFWNSFGTTLGAATGISPVTWGLSKLGIGGDNGSRDVGDANNKYEITGETQAAISGISQGIKKTFEENEQNYGIDYARQEQAREANRAYQAAVETGDKDKIAAMSEYLSVAMGGKEGKTNITASEAEEAGGYIQALRLENENFARDYKTTDLDATNGTLGLSATLTDSAITKATDGIAIFGDALSNRAGDIDSSLNKMVREFLDTPGDMNKFRGALDGMVQEGLETGMSLSQVGDAALATVKKLGDATSDISRLAMAVFEKTQTEIGRQTSTVGTGATIQARLESAQSLIDSADSTVEGQQRYERGKGEQHAALEEAKNILKQRLQMERQFAIQSKRANEDRVQSLIWAEKDYQKGVARAHEDYDIQRERSQRDFDKQIARGQEDFQRGRLRAQRDFNKQLKRMNEDAAKSMYDPYRRMQVQATYDFGTLMTNLREQNEAMTKQAQNLDELRRLGVNNNTIDQLGLNKSENAQQTQRMVSDLMSGGSAEDLNAMIAARMSAATVLNMDEANKDVARSKEDFHQQLTDQEEDFKRSVDRSKADFTTAMTDMESEFRKSLLRNEKDYREGLARQAKTFELQLERQREDIEESQKEILGTYDELQTAVFDVMAGKAVDFSTLMKSVLDETVAGVKNAYDAVDGFTGASKGSAPSMGNGGAVGSPVVGQKGGTRSFSRTGLAAGNTTSFIDDVAGDSAAKVSVTSVKRTGGGGSYHDKWQAVDYGGDPKELLKLARYLYTQQQEGNVDLSELIHWSPIDGKKYSVKDGQLRNPYSDKIWANHKDHVHVAMNPAYANMILADYGKTQGEVTKTAPHRSGGASEFAHGGIVTKPMLGLVGEAGDKEAIIPLNTAGVAVIAQAMSQYLSAADGQRMLTAGRGDRITYTGSQTWIEDRSTNVTGPITVQADDPNAMMRQLEAKARARNLTATPTRKGS